MCAHDKTGAVASQKRSPAIVSAWSFVLAAQRVGRQLAGAVGRERARGLRANELDRQSKTMIVSDNGFVLETVQTAPGSIAIVARIGQS